MDNDIYYQKWVEAQRCKIREWQRSNSKKKFVGERGYLHFDGKIFFKDHIDTGGHTINETLRNAEAVTKHKFLPFIRDDQRVRKFRDKKETTSLGGVRKHPQRFPTIKNRPIMFAAHRDACIYSFYGEILTRPYELILKNKGLDDVVLAYRKICNKTTGRNKSNIDLAQDFHKKMMSYNKVGILMADMSSFFDTIDHKRLADRWREILELGTLPSDHIAVLKSLTRYRYVFKREIYKALNLSEDKIKEISKSRLAALCGSRRFNQSIKKAGLIRQNKSGRGIPQGSPISGLLANIYMIIFDEKMHNYVLSRGGHYGRYSDDIVILIDESLLFDTYEFMKTLIKDEGIKINNKKTDCFTFNKATGEFINALNILEIDNPFNNKQQPQYLGFMYGSRDMFLRSATLARRFRGNNKLDKNRWNYFRLAQQKTHSNPMAKQILRIRTKIKRDQSM